MFTKYGKLALAYIAPPANNNTQVLPGLGTRYLNKALCLVKDAGGVERAATIRTNSSGSTFRSEAPTSTYGVYVGSGNTAPTENDHTLESPITNGLSATVSTSDVYDGENNRYIQRFEYTISNNGSEAVTIREIGYFTQQYYASAVGQDASSSNALFLIDRTVLTDEVVIPAGESSIVRYEFAYPYMDTTPEPGE